MKVKFVATISSAKECTLNQVKISLIY
uniref:Uncharacterized protein n=1 Tax=Arundo donax TaxID=35708 RepID=A0A0A8Y2X9_ARUDO